MQSEYTYQKPGSALGREAHGGASALPLHGLRGHLRWALASPNWQQQQQQRRQQQRDVHASRVPHDHPWERKLTGHIMQSPAIVTTQHTACAVCLDRVRVARENEPLLVLQLQSIQSTDLPRQLV